MFTKIQHKTIFGSKTPMYNNGSLFLKKFNINLKDNTSCCMKIHNLIINTCIQKIISFFNLFIAGDFKNLKENLNLEEYNEISVSLYNLKISGCPDYELIRQFIITSFESLYQSTIQQIILENITVNYNLAFDKLKILQNINELKEYINALLRQQHDLIPSISITAPLYNIKPEYIIYINKYGYPTGNVFDSDKLAQILEELNIDVENECRELAE